MTELVLAGGPARYLGGSIETFALPYGAFIIIAALLYFIFRRPHNVPKMRYLRPAHQTSVGTREPGTEGLISVRGPFPASVPAAEAQTTVPGLQPPHASETLQLPDVETPDVETPDVETPDVETPDVETAEGPDAPAAGGQAEGDA